MLAAASSDDVALAEAELALYRRTGRNDKVKEAEVALESARRSREEALPPAARLAALRQRVAAAETELSQLERA